MVGQCLRWGLLFLVSAMAGCGFKCEEIDHHGLFDISFVFVDDEGNLLFSSGNPTSVYSRDSLTIIELAPNPHEIVEFQFTSSDAGKTYNGGLSITDHEMDQMATETPICARYQLTFRQGDIDTLEICYSVRHDKDCNVNSFRSVDIKCNDTSVLSSSDYPTSDVIIVKK